MGYNLGARYFLHRTSSVILNRFHPGLRNGLRMSTLDSGSSLDYLLANPGISLARWGDGETMLAIGGQTPFQENSPELMRELLDVFRNPGRLPYALALPWRFLVKPHDAGTWGCWKHSRYLAYRYSDPDKPCLDAHMFRNESSHGGKRLEDAGVEGLWKKGKHVIVALSSRKAYELFTADYPGLSCLHLDVPAKNAYGRIDQIQEQLDSMLAGLDLSTTRLLIAAGPASKILVYRNCRRLTCYDLGHYFQHRYNIRKEG
ncbi:MAG TPA: hypothetical protein DET40_19125 [Lentisphaeria bacterium]|nr:MAG: hypothetical protein A2X45_25240 [Lentisphaerae bacterium GWF2_50_93]HCE45660.1 hypothetical protein [Lentisphaeria bacterium]